MHVSMKISYLFSSVYGRAGGGGGSAYCGAGGSARGRHWIYLSCYICPWRSPRPGVTQREASF